MTITDDFVQAYLREFDFFQEAARLCAQQCEKLLEANGIRAIVSYRAKRPDRLREKLEKRNGTTPYSSVDDCRSDIVDLAGVRAAVYFPADRMTFDRLIAEKFDVQERREFPGPNPRAEKRFTGYHATHYRVRLKSEDLIEPQRRYASTIIEIQVASVLMHAWSEVEHDLAYKPLSGELSSDEHAILDMLNGLIISGEIALEQLQKAVEKRVAQSGSRFTNHYELAAFLYEETKELRDESNAEPTMGRLNVLLRLLRRADLDTPATVRPFVAALDHDTEARPIADQIADRILAARPDLYQSFLEIQQEVIGHDSSVRRPATNDRAPHDLIGEFLNQWITFERFFRMLNRQENGRATTAVTERSLSKTFPMDTVTSRRMSFLRSLRNRVVHGVIIPDTATMREAISEFSAVFADLEASPDPHIKAAMRWAQSGEDDPMERQR
ncbi:RelA/SpoT domain-containing protein [Microvirga terrae]|uniref:RelA/SpoT domain-containing protein n=1 Tax=Microvirga terrae TaxID=2740529 RepID=A0ABY5RNN3_9HYPH|nr:RelA/SpoT domain-containing protein [Microvirga terrae]UVF18851.1 RelA/SpoT domain-containing protein [Microvirga terrae]